MFHFQISACIPFLRLTSGSPKIVFYCHFPDQLLTQRKSLLKSLYRKPIDWFEEKTTGMADSVLVNSKFTGKIFFLSCHCMKKFFNYVPTIIRQKMYKSTNPPWLFKWNMRHLKKHNKNFLMFLFSRGISRHIQKLVHPSRGALPFTQLFSVRSPGSGFRSGSRERWFVRLFVH